MLGNLGFLFVCLLLIACRHFAVNKGLKLKKEKYLRFSIGLADLFPQAGMGDSVAAERLAGRAAFSGGGAGQQKEEGQVPGNRTPANACTYRVTPSSTPPCRSTAVPGD